MFIDNSLPTLTALGTILEDYSIFFIFDGTVKIKRPSCSLKIFCKNMGKRIRQNVTYIYSINSQKYLVWNTVKLCGDTKINLLDISKFKLHITSCIYLFLFWNLYSFLVHRPRHTLSCLPTGKKCYSIYKH